MDGSAKPGVIRGHQRAENGVRPGVREEMRRTSLATEESCRDRKGVTLGMVQLQDPGNVGAGSGRGEAGVR